MVITNKAIQYIKNNVMGDRMSIKNKVMSNVMGDKISDVIGNSINTTDNNYITLREYNRREHIRTTMALNNITLTYSKNWYKIGLGGLCVLIAIIPNGLGVIFYPLGFSLILNGGINIFNVMKNKHIQIKSFLYRKLGVIL